MPAGIQEVCRFVGGPCVRAQSMEKFGHNLRDTRHFRSDLALIGGPFVAYLRDRHSAAHTIRLYCGVLRRAARWLHRFGRRLSSIERDDIPAILRSLRVKWPRPALAALRGWLKSRGRLEKPQQTRPWQSWINDYSFFMERDRGLSGDCQSHYLRVADRYMAWQFHRQRISWRLVSPDDIRQYAEKVRERGWKVKSVIDELSSLRQFLRFVHLRGGCSPELARAVPSVNARPRAFLREYLTEQDRRRLLDSFDRTLPEGRRDFTMALCMVDLGLRSIEVARLRVGDVDLQQGLIMVPAAKMTRRRRLPLPRHVASALRSYMRIRGETTNDFLFVGQVSLIGRPLTAFAIRAAIDRAYRRCGLPFFGTHRLRRSFATRLYARGANMKEIADLLGHQLVTTTERYAQVDPDGLRALARPWPA